MVASFLNSFAEGSQGAALSALFWWVIPIVALFGAIMYVVWTTRFKSKYENQVDRSVGRFRKFQDSFNNDSPSSDVAKNSEKKVSG